MEHGVELLSGLAEQLGTTAEYLWVVLVRQAPVSASIYGLLYPAMFASWIYLGKIFKSDLDLDTIRDFIRTIVGVIAALCLTIWGIIKLEYVITGFVNPEYWALLQILEAAGK